MSYQRPYPYQSSDCTPCVATPARILGFLPCLAEMNLKTGISAPQNLRSGLLKSRIHSGECCFTSYSALFKAPRPARTVEVRCQSNRHLIAARASSRRDEEGTASCSGRTAEPVDPFVAAALRLQSLVRGCGDSEEKLFDALVANESAEAKLQTSSALGGALCLAAVLIATLCREDPWGGASLSFNSLSWAAVGGLASLPFVTLRLLSWSPSVSRLLPAVDDMHRQQLQLLTPWLRGMNRGHALALMSLEVLPMLLLLLPAAQGVVCAWSSSLLPLLDLLPEDPRGFLGDGDARTPDLVVRAAGLLLTATVTGIARSLELGVSVEEAKVVEAAVSSSDRYYGLTSTDMHSKAEDAPHAALAFKCVAKVWLDSRSSASWLAGSLVFVDVLSLGCLWYATGNLAAPAVAALATNWVDYHHLHQALQDEVTVSKNSSQV